MENQETSKLMEGPLLTIIINKLKHSVENLTDLNNRQLLCLDNILGPEPTKDKEDTDTKSTNGHIDNIDTLLVNLKETVGVLTRQTIRLETIG